MLDAAVEHGTGIKAPTPYEIGHVCVEKEYEELQAWGANFQMGMEGKRVHTNVRWVDDHHTSSSLEFSSLFIYGHSVYQIS